MSIKRVFFLFAYVGLLLAGCKSSSSDSNIAYFGGEIINPSNDYVTFSSVEGIRDTIYLDDNNRFLHTIEELEAGLYTFTHGGEYQTILLEPKDSLFFRLNTNDFDESLVYTGVGSKKNNYFIQSFLENEIENNKFRKVSNLEPEEFVTHMSELKNAKLKTLETYLNNKPASELFKKIAESSINYNYYAYYEMYPFGHFGNNQLIHIRDLPEDFYTYRDSIDLNDESLTQLYVYNRFLFWHFNNLAVNKYYKEGQHEPFDRMCLDYNKEKLRLIDSNIVNTTIKNYLLKHNATDFILNSQDSKNSQALIDDYLGRCDNAEDKTEISELFERANKLKPGNQLPDSELMDYGGKELNLNSLIEAPTIVYCWSSNFKLHSRNSHYRIKELKAKFPKVNFVAINFNDNNLDYWKKTVKSHNYPSNDEYKFVNPIEALNTYVITYTHKIFLVDAEKKIVSSNVSLFDDKLEEQLAALSRR